MSPSRGVLNMVSSSRATETSVAAAWNYTRLWGNGKEGATERGGACHFMCAVRWGCGTVGVRYSGVRCSGGAVP